jgi:hypothetical protein
MLKHGLTHLHPAGFADRRVRDIPIATNLIGGIYNDDSLRFCQDACRFTKQGGLTHAWAPQDEKGLTRLDDILDDIHRSVNGTPDPACEPDDMASPVAQTGYAMQCALEASPIIRVKLANSLDHMVQFGAGDFFVN